MPLSSRGNDLRDITPGSDVLEIFMGASTMDGRPRFSRDGYIGLGSLIPPDEKAVSMQKAQPV